MALTVGEAEQDFELGDREREERLGTRARSHETGQRLVRPLYQLSI
jgi:hypothetical protein